MASCRTIMATTSSSQSSCQPHHHQVVGTCLRDRERANSGLKTLSGAKPRVFSSKMAIRGRRRSLFARFRGSIGESCRQKVHRTVARAQFLLGKCYRKLWRSQRFCKMRSTNVHKPVARARFHIKILNRKKLSRSEHFWKMRSEKCARVSFIHSFIHSCIHSFILSFFHSFILSFIHSFTHCVSFHFTSFHFFPISKLVPLAVFYFRNFRPGACQALPGTIFWYILGVEQQCHLLKEENRRVPGFWCIGNCLPVTSQSTVCL